MIRIKHKGSFRNTERFFAQAGRSTPETILRKYGQLGVTALASATPTEHGTTAAAWSYEISSNAQGCAIYWTNSNVHDGVNIAMILQYGHGTGTGGYVKGVDYVNPALEPIFNQLAEEAWREVTK